jgi:predicted CxxxxCH...CXXCH cytochrome family protein
MGLRSLVIVFAAVWLLGTSQVAEAIWLHNVDCNNCHKTGSTYTTLDASNVCLSCHGKPTLSMKFNADLIPDHKSDAGFDLGDASNALGSVPPAVTPQKQTSHFWAAKTDVNAAAGAEKPQNMVFFSRYGTSTGKVTCTRCHNPHGEQATQPQLLKLATAEAMCKDCHRSWNIGAGLDANLSHPLPVGTYASYVSDGTGRFQNIPAFDPGSASSATLLPDGTLGCTTCHGAHFVDSDATTADGPLATQAGNGDGRLLRGDGPTRAGGTRNETAQLRSNLCQSCHTYQLHGNGTSKIGCLDCHGGHSYNGGTPSDFILSDQSPDAVPTRVKKAAGPAVVVDFPVFSASSSTRIMWADQVDGGGVGGVGVNGLCEQCHGDVNDTSVGGLGTFEATHLTSGVEECVTCHNHGDAGYSFALDASAATCGACHGFPPYLNQAGDVQPPIGGYANNVELGYDYLNDSTHFKDETQTAHKTHAGADLPTTTGQWYYVGESGIQNCQPCHGPDASKTAGGHRIPPTTDANTFRNIPFDVIATGQGNLVPVYKIGGGTDATCSQVYCHSAGAPRTGDVSRNWTAGLVVTPKWVGTGFAGDGNGFDAYSGNPNRCQICHGNDVATMGTKGNTAVHSVHLSAPYSYACGVCHDKTAVDKDTLAVGATDHRSTGPDGQHVDGVQNVVFSATALNATLAGDSYDSQGAGTGTCSVYCHDPSNTGKFADWDSALPLGCADCHEGRVGDASVISTGSHTRHVSDPNGPQLACSECHGTNADAGTHSGHVDGTVAIIPPVDGVTFSSICEECHGFDAEAGEVLPVWGNSTTTDCATCHAGPQCGITFKTMSPPSFDLARSSGHNRPTASGTYPQSGNLAANADCETCHLTDSPLHWDGSAGDFFLRVDAGFPATYAGFENDFCYNCHGTSPAHPTNAASVATRSITSHRGKNCIACHNLHGDANIQMVWTTQANQVSHDSSVTGKYAGDVFFTNNTDFTAGNLNSFDEDDNNDGVTTENNGDDICATCHSVAAGTAHNNINNTGTHSGSDNLGSNCTSACHSPHSDPVEAFIVAAGTACNNCHDYPPATGAHALHSQVSSYDKDLDADRSDCALCHTGADSYTYDTGADQVGGLNHSYTGVIDGSHPTNRNSILSATVGFNNADKSCASACHASNVSDGTWTDANGLSCNACHYYSATPTSAGNVTASNSEAISTSHNEHFDKSKLCSACHNLAGGEYNNGSPIVGPLSHINDSTGASEALMYTGMAAALQNEAGFDEGGGVRDVVRSGMTYNDANTCSGGITTGCHASGSPIWDNAIPATSAGCVQCHTNTDDAAYNPTSGLHDNNPSGPTVTGESHDGSFNGAASDCTTCHSTSPTAVAANHINGTLNSGAAITVQAIAGYNQGAGTCATTCHSVGTAWEYKWTTDAFLNDNVRECNGCHGLYSGITNSTGWSTGTIHATSGYENRGEKHNNTGSSGYPCDDCHAIGSGGVYTFSSWGVNQHGDDNLQINNNADHGFTTGGGTAGCNASCHAKDATHDLPDPGQFAVATVAGNQAYVACSGCHGGGTLGDVSNYWPDGVNVQDNGTEDNSGAHLKHIVALAAKVWNETATGAASNDILRNNTTNNPGVSSDTKQRELCTYCHGISGTNPIDDGTHGDTAYLPADVSGMYTLWSKSADNGVYSNASDSCATVDCHGNKATDATATSFGWYQGNTSACVMCHVNVTDGAVPNSTGGTHVAHTSAATNFGRVIGCNECHQTAAENVQWGTPGTPPASGHIDGTFAVSGSVSFTYTAGQGCATNECHNAGDGTNPPAIGVTSYPWGTALADCTICHAAVPTLTAAHSQHLGNTSYVAGCADCHASETLSTHIDAKADFSAKITAPASNSGWTGSCTNTCHLAGDAGDWTGGAAAVSCTDCHAAATGYVGDNTGAYLPQYNMHNVTPTVSGEKHVNTLTGAGGSCAFCHTTISAQGTHINGVWTVDDADNTNDQNRGLFAAYSDALTGGSCSGAGVASCHSDGGSWSRQWKATAGSIGGPECANCHGSWGNWRAGTTHANARLAGENGNNGTHNDAPGANGFECVRCHGFGDSGNVYKYTATTNDWFATDASATTLHGNGNINMNSNGVTLNQHNLSSMGRSGCTSCHEGADGTGVGNTHDFPASGFGMVATSFSDGVAGGGGGCTTCHGDGGSGEYWPQNADPNPANYPNRNGKHAEHVSAVAIKLGGDTQGNRNASCNYCHAPTTLPATYDIGVHNDNVLPSADFSIRHILNQTQVDTDAVINRASDVYVTCSTIDCHFNNAVTPHWYTDDIAPALVTLTAVAGPNPRSIKVSWNAPGDDNNVADTTPYVYDMRYGTSAATATNFGLTTNYAGNLPAAYKQGSLSEAIIENLNFGTTYYFSLKSCDVVGNCSPASAAVSASPTADTLAPDFGGADKAVKGDEGGTINLYWTAAEDHSMPITYKIWLKDEAAGTLDMDVDPAIITGWGDTKIELDGANGIANDHIYHLGVRACDALNNCDTNIVTVSATPTAVPEVDKTYHSYVTSGSMTLVKDGSPGAGVVGTPLNGATGIVFAPGTNNTYAVTYYVDTFAVYLDTGNGSATVRAELGTSTNGTNFTPFGIYPAGVGKEVTLGTRSDRVYQFKLVDTAGKTVNAGQRLAIRLSEPSTGVGVKANYGSTAYRGDVTLAERLVNQAPNPGTDPGSASLTGAIVDIQWDTYTDTADGLDGLAGRPLDVVHYDLYGSNDGGLNYEYVIAEGLDDTHTSWQWDTQTAGITSGNLAVRIRAGDGYAHTTTNVTTGLGSADVNDYVAPSAIDDLLAQARPKTGSVWLTWTAPGDDYGNHGRADHYEIRYSTAAINEGNFASASLATNTPSPDFGGHIQNFEVTGVNPGTNYFFAIKTFDEAGNASLISTAKAAGTDQEVGGPRCGMCHTTAPSVTESVGNHKLHGFTIEDCTHCHGAGVTSYTLAHQDGILAMGFGPGGPHAGIIAGNRIFYTDDGTPGGTVLYDDTDGFGGFGTGNYAPAGDGVDDGSCFNWGPLGVGGCHGPAGGDPDGGGPLPTFATPNWNAAATLDCAQCHGNPSRTTDSFYGRDFDGTVANASVVPDQILGAPRVDNHGNYDLAAPLEEDRKYNGQHEKHLNYSFRFAKGDSCNLCHEGDYADRNNLDGRHANGDIDVKLNTTAAGDNAIFTPGTATTAGTCSNMSPESCHPSASTPKWDSTQTFECRQCHGMGGVTPSHTTDPAGSGFSDDGLGNCTWCHFGGHPRTDEGGTALILANNSQVGLNYRSGGIHLRKSIGGRASQATEAQLCWTCHDTNGISEWGTDTGSNNTSTAPPNASNYNYGSVTSSNWTTATWSSSVTNFAYKTGLIQSTHTTNELGTSAVIGSLGSYTETKDTVDMIRCSNCHDVHNLNKAPGDTMTGQPYLRGTWVRNPYPEDGAPWGKAYTVTNALYGAVPRAGGAGGVGNEQGGYQIDQNNGSPTAGLSVATSGGLCMLCHGSVGVDDMDKTADAENLWVGAAGNGHSNATLGGTGSNASNIFGDGIGGRPGPSASTINATAEVGDIYVMGMQVPGLLGTGTYAYGYRNAQGKGGPRTPVIGAARPEAYDAFTWGVSVDAGTTDIGYHAFTCSKCHNPHASRLPKLMITNCLDTRHNTWQSSSPGQGNQTQAWWTGSTSDVGEKAATWNTAQNCHRYDTNDNVGGWNKVTPW